MTANVSTRLYQLLADVLGVDATTLNETSSPDTVEQWDSLNHLMIVTALESEFGLQISIDEAVAMRSVGAIRDHLASHGQHD